MNESSLRARLRALLLDARRDRDRAVAGVVRGILAELENAEAVPTQGTEAPGSEHVAGASVGVGSTEAQRQTLDEDQEREVVHRELDQVTATLERLARLDSARAVETAHAVQVVRDVLSRERR